MAIFNPGTGTLKSLTLEAAFVEACQLLEFAEESSTNPETVNFTTLDHDNGPKTLSITCNLPITVSVNSSGRPEFTVREYLVTSFSPSPDISSTYLQAAVLEIAQKLQEVELTTENNKINLTYDTDVGLVLINAVFESIKNISTDGSINIAVTPYL